MYDLNNEGKLDNHMEFESSDFYPPEDRNVYVNDVYDTRFYTSGVEDIEGGDNFYDYAEYFWDTYGHELYDEI